MVNGDLIIINVVSSINISNVKMNRLQMCNIVDCWAWPGIVGHCWARLGIVGHYWAVWARLGNIKNSEKYLAVIEKSIKVH